MAGTKSSKTKKCDGFIKIVKSESVSVAPCGLTLKIGENCPRRADHILRYKTGQCENGWCEGIKPRTKSDKPAPSCKMYLTCPCSCHAMLDKMFNQAGMERILVERSEYKSPERSWWMPSDDVSNDSSTSPVPGAAPRIESPAPGRVPPNMARQHDGTPTGRAGRGELEAWVKNKCDEWTVEEYPWLCTPKWISESIAHDQGIKAPSVGAIGAVFERWTKIGFAVTGIKPVRFVGYTELALQKGLHGIKADMKRQRKMVQADQRRGVR